jgi:hypothetical protein
MTATKSTHSLETPVSDADHVQLSRLVTEAAWRVDTGRADTLHDLFTADGILNMSEPLTGHEQIRRWGRQAVDAHTFDGIRHVCGNMRFVYTSPDTAEGITVLTVFMDHDRPAPGTSVPWVVGEDHDTFAHTADGWRISTRTWISLFERAPAIAHL